MSEPDAWFYTHEGTRHGPVTFAELQALATGGSLNPRLDLTWKQGMADWQPAGDIDGLFERRPNAAAPDSIGTPYQPPAAQPAPQLQYPDDEWPGARRRTFLTATVLVPFAWQLLFSSSAPVLTEYAGPGAMEIIAAAAPFVLIVLSIHYGLLRLVNLGMSRWWYLANFVPLLNLWIGYRCFACPAGYAYHKKLDGAGVALAIFYWLMLVLVVLAIAAVIAFVAFSMKGDATMQSHLDELLKTVREQAARKP